MQTLATTRRIPFFPLLTATRRAALIILALVGLFLTAYSARATVTSVAYWRLGESDLGGAPGVAVTNVTDLAGSHPLIFHGPAAYAVDVSSSASNSVGSTLSVNFTNSAYATNSIVSTAVDDFGIECWVKPTTAGANQVIVYNGNTGGGASGGWGFFIANDNTYQVLFGGVLLFGTNAATPNVWTHLALVRAGGTATLYVNGKATESAINAPKLPQGNFALATVPQSIGSQNFTGLIDEVRVFTFDAGQFSTNDLLLNRVSLVVTNLADIGPGTLRECLMNPAAGVITFATNGVITLASELPVTYSMTIRGPGVTNLAISGNNLSRVFNIFGGVSATISGLTIRDGAAPGGGGGIYNAGNLTVNSCVLANNAAQLSLSGLFALSSPGGGIYNVGFILLNSCTLYNNRAGGASAASVGNGATGNDGGALYNLGNAILVQCTVCSNSAGRGGDGGFGYPVGASGGSGGNGGGIVNTGAGSLKLVASTVAMNNPGAGGIGGSGFPTTGSPGATGANGGILNSGSQFSLINTIVGTNLGSSSPDVLGSFTSLGHNLIGNTNGATGITNGINGDLVANPSLGPFDFYGGQAATHILTVALLPGSPALNAGDDTMLSSPYFLTADERGLPRKFGAHVDIGAYESDVTFGNAVVTTALVTPFEDPTYGYWLATLQGTVNPGGYPSTIYFDYGTTAGYGQVAPAGTLAILNLSNNQVSATISNLIISQTYHYRVVASNSLGTFPGNDQMFTITLPAVADLNGDGAVDAFELAAVLGHLGTNRVSASNVNQVLLNYLGGDPLLMTNVAGLGNSNVTFGLSNSPAVNFTVQSSTNLTDWQTLGPAQLLYRFADTNAPLGPNRQYRLVYP
jgi:hypothetical protein